MFKPLFNHTVVLSGGQYWVRRSDDDYACLRWPLFFVHILSDENMDFLEQHLDSIQASIHLDVSEMVKSIITLLIHPSKSIVLSVCNANNISLLTS